MVAETQKIVEELEALDLRKDDEEIVEKISSTTQLNSDRIPQKTHTMVTEIQKVAEDLEALDLKKDDEETAKKISSTTPLNLGEIQNVVEDLEALDLQKGDEEIAEKIDSTTQLNSGRIPQKVHIMVAEIQEIIEELETLDLKKDKEQIFEKDRPWSNLHDDILSLILSPLFAGDKISFLSVCKSWKLTSVLPIRRFHLPISSHSECQSPCLLFSYNNIYENKIFHPVYNEYRNMSFEFGLGTQVYVAKNDWLLLYECRRRLFFFNPFTETKIEIPNFPCADPRSVCFTSLPTSTDWRIVAAGVKGLIISPAGVVLQSRGTVICSIKCGDENWSSVALDDKYDFNLSFCSAVIHKGSCYFLDMNAKVLIYNIEKRTASVYMAPKCINKHIYDKDRRYLLKDNAGKLMAVFVGVDGSWIRICQWDDHKKTWIRVSDLGNKTLFVSRASSLCEEASARGTRNTIYFPRVVDDHCLFYSLSTKKYHTFVSGSSYHNFCKSKLRPGGTATWIRP